MILPKEIDGLDTLVDKLKDPSALELATSKMGTFRVDVFLPKFTIETKTDLENVLKDVSTVNNVSNYGS